MSPKRSAFVVANDAYQDGRLRRLRAPAADAEELAGVLSDEGVGGFDEVEVSMNEPEHLVRRKLATFFDDRGLDDLLVLHLSCHGLKDEDGRLYFATADTDIDYLDATAIPSEFVNRLMTRSRSRRIILLLDCCYSGAFAAGLLSRGDDRVDIKERFDGRGRVVLTASSAMEYSFEGDEIAGEGRPSVFTSALVRGLATGDADRNHDGWISVDELYDYAYDEVRAATPSQTPGKWVFDVQGDLIVARSRIEVTAEEEPLPAELLHALRSPFAHVRAGAVEELASFLEGPDERQRDAARHALVELAADDSRRVADAAARVIGQPEDDVAQETPDAPAPPEVPVAEALEVPVAEAPKAPVAEAPRVPVAEAPAPAPEILVVEEAPVAKAAASATQAPGPARASILARAGALALLAAIALPFLAWNTDSWNVFAVLSPIEAVGAALVTWGVARAARNARIDAAFAAGLLLAIGVLTSVGSIGLIRFTVKRLDAPAVACAIVALCGAVAIVAAGVAHLRAASDARAGTMIDPGALLLALAGGGLAVAALFVDYDGFSSLWSEIGDSYSAEFFFEPAAVVVVMLAGLGVSGTRPRLGSGLLVGVGGVTAVHYLGVVIAAWRAVGEVGDVRPAGFIGLVGGLLAAASGAYAFGNVRRSDVSA